MDAISKITKLMFATAALVLATGALIFALKYNTGDAQAVSSHRRALPVSGQVFTQSSDGKTLWAWGWDRRIKQWKRYSNRKAGRR